MATSTVTITETIKEKVAETVTVTSTHYEQAYTTLSSDPQQTVKDAAVYLGYSIKKLAIYGFILVLIAFTAYVCYGLYIVFAQLAYKANYKMSTNDKIRLGQGGISLNVRRHTEEEKMDSAKKLASKLWAGYSYEDEKNAARKRSSRRNSANSLNSNASK